MRPAKSQGRTAVRRPSDLRSSFPTRVRDAWAEFLGRWAWEWFCTLTFSEAVHPEKGEKCFRVWIARVNDRVFGRHWRRRKRGVTWARATELQRRGAIHFHALVAGVGDLRRLTMMDEWAKLAGWARIRAVQRQDLVRKYVSKYVAKGGEIDLGGPSVQRERDPELW